MTSPVIAIPVVKAPVMAPAAVANSAGFARRLTSLASSSASTVGSWIGRIPGAGRVAAFGGTVAGWAKTALGAVTRVAKAPLTLWTVAHMATTKPGQQLIGMVFRPVRWALRQLGRGLRAVVHTPLTWLRIEKVYDTPAAKVAELLTKAKVWAAPHVVWTLNPDRPVMLVANTIATIGLARAWAVLPIPGVLGTTLRVLTYIGAACVVVGNLFRIAYHVPAVQSLVQGFVDGVTSDLDEGAIAVADTEVAMAQEKLDANPDSEKARQDLLRAQRIHADLMKRQAENEAIAVQEKLLEEMGQLAYAIALRERTEGITSYPAVMSYRQATKVLKRFGQPTARQNNSLVVASAAVQPEEADALNAPAA